MGKRWLSIVAALLIVLIGLAGWRSLDKSKEEGRPSTSRTHPLRQELKAFWAAYDSATEQRIAGEWQRAADLYERALQLNPRHEESIYYLGNCHFDLGDYARAAQAYRRLLKVNPESNRGHSQLGLVLSSPWPGAPVDFEEAEDALLRSVQLYPEESGVFVRLGRLALAQGREEEALKYFDQAAGFRSAEGIFWAGFVRFRQSRFHEAAARFYQVLQQQRREKRMAGKGIASEGDTAAPDAGRARSSGSRGAAPARPAKFDSNGVLDDATPGSEPAGAARSTETGLPDHLQSAALRSRVYLYWSWRRLGGYPPEIPEQFKVHSGPSLHTLARSVNVDQGFEVAGARRGAWADYDGDGDDDLAIAGSEEGLRLYRNQAGSLNRLHLPSLPIHDAWDVAWGDFDSDGRPDIYLVAAGYTGTGRNLLLRQAGPPSSPVFEDVTAASGLEGERGTAKALFLDIDGDGRLDLLEAGNQGPGVPALRLFCNLAGETFRECGREAGVGFDGNAVDAAVGDYNGDGRPDLLVMRWKRSLVLYRNEGDGTFSDASAVARLPNEGQHGFSGLFVDFDRDGRQDLLITRYPDRVQPMEVFLGQGQGTRSSVRLFRNLDGETFEDVTAEAGLSFSFSVLQVARADLDQDGWDDLVVANGSLDHSRLEPSVILRNDRGHFSIWGYLPAFDHPIGAAGVAVADPGQRGRPVIYLAGAGLFQPR